MMVIFHFDASKFLSACLAPPFLASFGLKPGIGLVAFQA